MCGCHIFSALESHPVCNMRISTHQDNGFHIHLRPAHCLDGSLPATIYMLYSPYSMESNFLQICFLTHYGTSPEKRALKLRQRKCKQTMIKIRARVLRSAFQPLYDETRDIRSCKETTPNWSKCRSLGGRQQMHAGPYALFVLFGRLIFAENHSTTKGCLIQS